jgi:hypothetical protein
VNWFGLIFLAVVLIGIAVAFARLQLRERHNSPLKEWVRSQPVTFSSRVLVRKRANGGVGWVDFKSLTGVQFLIRGQGVEVSLVPPMDRIVSTAEFLRADGITMWIDRIGWAGSPVAKQDCIRLDGMDLNGKVELAISPRDLPIEDAWSALLDAGATPIATDPPVA